MFARHVAVKLRPDTLAEFIRVMDNEVLPWLRKQKGFLDTMILAVPGGKEIVSISFWDQEESAEVYNSTNYPQALDILKKILAELPGENLRCGQLDAAKSWRFKFCPARGSSPPTPGGHNDSLGSLSSGVSSSGPQTAGAPHIAHFAMCGVLTQLSPAGSQSKSVAGSAERSVPEVSPIHGCVDARISHTFAKYANVWGARPENANEQPEDSVRMWNFPTQAKTA